MAQSHGGKDFRRKEWPPSPVRRNGNRARIKVTAGHIGWADLIFVMEKKHVRRLHDQFSRELTDKRIICLNIGDDYQFMSEDLVTMLEAGVTPHLNP